MTNGKKRSLKKWIIGLVLLAAAAGGGGWYLKGRSPAPPAYQTARVTRGDLINTVTATGQLNPVLNVQVGSQVSGIIQKLHVDFNSRVKEGQLIAQLDPATYQARLNSAEGSLASAQASLELAQVNARRNEELVKSKLIAAAEYDDSMAKLHQAEAQVKISASSLESAKVDLARCTIYAPVDGIVIDRKVDVGQTVAASLSAPVLFQIANDLTKMQINASVAEADIGGIEVGQDVDFTVDAFPFLTFHGKVIQVRNAPLTVQNVVTYDTIIEVANPDLKLKPGMTANVSIIIARREDVLRVPNAALRFRPPENAAVARTNAAPTAMIAPAAPGDGARRGGGGDGERRRGPGGGERPAGRPRGEARPPRSLYTLVQGAAKAALELKPAQVKLGLSDGIMTEVMDGLTEGEWVVLSMTAATSNAPQSNPFGPAAFPRR